MASIYRIALIIGDIRRIDDTKEKQYYITCNYKPGDKVRYKWINDEIRTGTVTHIDFSVNIKDSMTGNNLSIHLKNVIGYNTEK